MTLSIDRLSLASGPEDAQETSISRGQELYDLAQLALIAFKAGTPPEGVSAVYGKAAGDTPKDKYSGDDTPENKYYVTPGLNVVSRLGVISVQEPTKGQFIVTLRGGEAGEQETHYLPDNPKNPASTLV